MTITLKTNVNGALKYKTVRICEYACALVFVCGCGCGCGCMFVCVDVNVGMRMAVCLDVGVGVGGRVWVCVLYRFQAMLCILFTFFYMWGKVLLYCFSNNGK